MEARYEEIVTLTNGFCEAHLNEEYAEMCRLMTATLARKRPSPLTTGKAAIWAGGIIHAVGTVNFVFDKSTKPFIKSPDIAAYFQIGQSSSTNKSKEIRDMFKIRMMDPNWTLPSRIDSNPMAWYISVDGFIIDARHARRDIQEAAFAKGLIPYIPADKNKGEE